jgi:hypothetical protein
MIGVLASLVVSVLPAMPPPGVTCAEGPASCDAAWPPCALVAAAPADDDADGPRDYATPVEVTCPTPAPTATAPACDDDAPVELWRAISRVPGSDRPGTTLGAPRRASHTARVASACGVPAPDGGHFVPTSADPLALPALPSFVLATARSAERPASVTPPARSLAPPDRPPRTV